jgi:DNA-binding MarR family transcriptional regulator
VKATKRAAARKAGSGQNKGTKRAACPEEQVFLELLRTTDQLSRRLAGLLKDEELSSNQYNVLRILRGAAERGASVEGAAARRALKAKSGAKAEGLACGEIGERMITRDPDITRLLDRLERRGLIARWRDESDRRVVMARITPEGLKLLSRMDLPVQQAHKRELGHLGQKRLGQLVELLRVAREPQAIR